MEIANSFQIAKERQTMTAQRGRDIITFHLGQIVLQVTFTFHVLFKTQNFRGFFEVKISSYVNPHKSSDDNCLHFDSFIFYTISLILKSQNKILSSEYKFRGLK